MGNQQSGGANGGGDNGKKEKEKKRYEPPVPTRVGKKLKKSKVNSSFRAPIQTRDWNWVIVKDSESRSRFEGYMES